MIAAIYRHSIRYLRYIKFFTGIFAFIYIYSKIYESVTIHSFHSFSFASLSAHNYMLLAISILLMFANWSIESYKWKTLVDPIEEVSFSESIKAIISGITVGMFTPNRIGEFGGRVLYISPSNRVKAGLHTVMGSFSQLIITMIIGSLAFIYILYTKNHISDMALLAMSSLSIFLSFILISVYYNYRFLWNYVRHSFFYSLIKKSGLKLALMPAPLLNKSLFLSFIRYVIFNLQYLLLLYGLGFEISLIHGFIATSAVFFIQTAVPTIALFELGIRSAGAIGILTLYQANEAVIIIASILLWLINLIVPALFGLLLLMFHRFENKTAE